MSAHPSDRPLSEVLRSIGDDLSRLMRGEIALLKTELQHNVARIGSGAGLLGGAGVVGLFALEFILLAAMFGISAMGLPLWGSALILGALLGIVAGVLAMSGKKKVSGASVAPVETIEQVKADAAVLKHDIDRIRSRK